MTTITNTDGLPPQVERVLGDFVETAKKVLGDSLAAIVLYGSAAERRLRATSDVNVILVLATFDAVKTAELREALRTAHAAVRLKAMFLLEQEIKLAAETFAVKFSDVLHRHRVLFGKDPFSGLAIPRQAEITRLRQVLFNLTLRLRSDFVLKGLRQEQLAFVIADVAGPLRACAATLLELKGQAAKSPKEALEQLASFLEGADWKEVLVHVSQARETRLLPPGIAGSTILRLIDLAQKMRVQAEKIS